MKILFVVSEPDDWPLAESAIDGVQVITARQYLREPAYAKLLQARVFNLCHCTAYQRCGYYVSMLAEARGHRPLPDVKAIEDLHAGGLLAALGDSLEEDCQCSLAALPGNRHQLDIWLGRCSHAACTDLAGQLFKTFGLPLMRVHFDKPGSRWQLTGIAPLRPRDLDAGQLQALAHDTREYLHRQQERHGDLRRQRPRPSRGRPAVAILRTPGDAAMPSNHAAIGKFREAAEAIGMRAEIVSRHDAPRIGEFDALFIRDTTNVNDETYRIARRACIAGLVVIDDPDSIIRCSNKVFLHELLVRHRLPVPRSLLLHRDNLQQAIPTLGVPLILKQPDSAFSMGVVKIETPRQLADMAAVLFRKSALLLAQEYLPTAFDWRIGILDRKPLFACRYHMAPGHWQVIKHEGDSRYSEGLAEAVDLDAVPGAVLALALAAAKLIGDGFYGVDLKQRDGHCTIIEINDNPNVDAGNEDGVLHDALYRQVLGVIRDRIHAARGKPL
jgi:glutathione synthase/RimK-type ligase-like ATP-grasp enzyme